MENCSHEEGQGSSLGIYGIWEGSWRGYSKVNVVMNRLGGKGVLWNQKRAAAAAGEGMGFLAAGESGSGSVGRLVVVSQTLLSLNGELRLLTRFRKLTCFSLVYASAGF